MTQQESADLMNDTAFRGRVKVCCLRFADSIMNEDNSEPAHNTRLKWAAQTMEYPDVAAIRVHPPTVMDAAVQSAGAAIDDGALQSAVEATVKKFL